MEAYIRDLRPRDRDKVIEAKVYRSWMSRDPPDVTEKGLRAILLDKQGDAIQAYTDINDKNHFTSILIPGKAYRISRISCVPTDNCQQTLENTTSLSFSTLTKFDTIPSGEFPNHYFDFVAYNQLPYKVVDSNDPTKTEYPVLTDYIGCYMRSTDKQKWGNPNRNQMVNRKIEIQNLNRTSIELTLWDDLANTFKKDEIDALEKPVLIAVSSCRVTRYRNTLQLQSTPATYYYINPKIPELEEYLQEYRTLFNINPPLQIVRHPYEDKEQEKMRNRIPLDVLLKESPQSHIYYPSCTKCNIKAEIHEGTFDCKAHGTLESPNYKYNFKAYITDGSATAMITFFTPKADDFIGVNCNSLVRSLTNPDPRKIPPEVNSIVGKRYIFQFHFNTSSKQKPPDFVFNQISDTPWLPHQIGSTTSGSNLVEKTCPTIEYPSTSTVVPYLHTEKEPPTQETQDEGTPVPETEAQFNTGTPIRPMEPEQLPEVQQLTPMHGHQPEDDTPTVTPSTPHTGMQTRSRTDEANRRAIRRPLFPEESPDNKKKKS
ncbi:nucleic acid-binding, OB-fold protein [Artemisia annua]|uniref:Nucleic acid-binding, OB-fold protein n=1 Tax=Artemisia annua TaxID=35608 RepID=A0A2U1LCX7_ARTAN|nr:nucleic acid-binding, OB-fold protein [Artemisia annua]